MKKEQVALIVGGSSGLGLEIALLLAKTHRVFITGRRDPRSKVCIFFKINLDKKTVEKDISSLVTKLPHIDILVYAAGFYQEGTLTDLRRDDVDAMIHVGLLAPILLIKKILTKQRSLDNFIAVTSTSQWTPRLLEPVYTAVKAGLGMLSNSLSLDDRLGKVLVAGPAGMNTRFWEKSPRGASTMLDPSWVAKQVIKHLTGRFKYKFIRILRNPSRVEVVEKR